ncbi:sensor histidine kinase [Desulfobacula toluolica]|uniref:histidine kinase n=1 Tax=Desulfobacula toluolica (strain DSM 7467 / Tol2) TaxID=651182 RepID=K0NAZ7_DESTT|nr:HAMP domain-containing sensor histidine kinase [Desulfobacula toluolica]CCK81409.1 PhoR: phosphate regulon sensor protein [Desulfobacula toluolica Tol2]
MEKRKKKLIWHIFPSFLLIIFLSLSAITSYSTSYFKKFFLKNSEKELTIRTTLLQKKFSDMLKNGPDNYHQIDMHCKDIEEKTDTRVTVLLPSGVVIGDSSGDIATMENHMKRPEIMEAMKRKKGICVRYSATLDKNMMYIALPVLQDKEVAAVVRTAVSISGIDTQIKSIRNNILIALLVTIIIAGLTSLYVAGRISHPVEEMTKGTAEFAKGNLTARIAVPESEELSELAVTMNHMAQALDDKITAFENRSMELEAVHSSMQEGVIAIDKNERIITINDAAARVFGFSASKLKARYILEIARHFELQKFIQKALATHKPVEDDIVIAGDKERILNIHSTALYETAGRRMGTLIIFHDITRIRRLERMHIDFAANVSHELKTPLTTIKGFVETLQQMTVKNELKEGEAFLNIIEKNVDRMIDLINDLLALAKLERLQGTKIQLEKHNISGLIQGAVSNCDFSIEKKNISVSIDCPEDISAMVDPGLMEQAIINIVDNAVKYSPEGKSIHISVTSQGRFVDIMIKDNGNGMNKEHLSKIFNRFYRVDRARSRNEGGTGLGLAIVKHIVQYHNGKIDVTSTKGRGSCFTLSIPA